MIIKREEACYESSLFSAGIVSALLLSSFFGVDYEGDFWFYFEGCLVFVRKKKREKEGWYGFGSVLGG